MPSRDNKKTLNIERLDELNGVKESYLSRYGGDKLYPILESLLNDAYIDESFRFQMVEYFLRKQSRLLDMKF